MTGALRPIRLSSGKVSAVRVGAAAMVTLVLVVLAMWPVAVPGGAHQATAAPTVSREFRISNDDGYEADIASDGTNFLVVWTNAVPPEHRVYGSLVGPSGEVLAGPMPIAASSTNQGAPAVAWSGSAYEVVWTQYNGQQRDIHIAEVSASGSVSTPVPLVTGVNDQFDPALVYAGSERWLAYVDEFDPPGPNNDVISIVLATTGSSSVLASGTGGRAEPALAWDDVHNRLLIAWNAAQTGIDARRFDVATRKPIGAAFPVASAFGWRAHPAVAWNGSDRWAVVWDDHRWTSTSLDVYGTLVHADGTILAESIPISVGPGDQRTPDIAWNTQEFIVLWRDSQSTTTADLYGTTLASDGTVDDDAFVVSESGEFEAGPAVSAGPATKVGIAYEKLVDGGSAREGVYFRTSPK